MRILDLFVRQFKNLRDLRVRFNEGSSYTVLVGGNGSGKSNLIEAIAWIFRNLDLGEPAPFDYELRYECRNNEVQVVATRKQTPKFAYRPLGFDLRLMSWGDGAGVPTSGNNLVIVGTDNNNLLHIRIFDRSGTRATDADETKLLPAQAPAILALKNQLPGLLAPHVLTDPEKVQVLGEAASIAGQTWPLGTEKFKRISKSEFMREDEEERPLYRPAFIFGYYSGPSRRLAELFEKHRERFRRYIIKPSGQRTRGPVSSNSLRRFFYAQTVHGQFALLAFFMDPSGTEDRDFLKEHLRISGLDAVMFALKKPDWSKQGRKGGDDRFWQAEGEVRDLLSRLYDAALVPMRMPRRMQVDLAKNPPVDNLYLFLPNQQALAEVFAPYENQYAFFTALESIDISTLLGEVVTRVTIDPQSGGGAVTYRDLSEGEQQLLLVLGLLKFTAEDEALFLLDEPDTHLNPAWSVEYIGFVDRFVKRRDNCHILLATHDPLLFSSLLKEQVRVLSRHLDGSLKVDEPEVDPRGMGIEAILTSDLFRLRTTLDKPTQELLDTRRRLSMKSEPLTESERKILDDVNKKLRPLAFSKTIRDPLYQLFLEAWTSQEDPAWREAMQLSEEQRQERELLAAKIAVELQAEMSSGHDGY